MTFAFDALRLAIILYALYSSVSIRLFAVEIYGTGLSIQCVRAQFAEHVPPKALLRIIARGLPRATGRVIHEFDPWFNFRATEYMVENGWEKFQVSNLRIK